MGAKHQSKNRKHPSSSNPFIGIFTRSKSQIFIHRNRSGRARSDSTRKRKHYADFEKPSRKLRTSNQRDISQIDAMPHNSIKDLRARRVFSPTSIIDECCPRSFENEGTMKFDYIKLNLNDAKLSESIGEVEKLDTGFSYMAQKDNPNPNLQSIADHSRSKKDGISGVYCDDGKKSEMDSFKEWFTCMSEDSNGVNLNSSKTHEGLVFGNAEQRSEEDCFNQPVKMTSEVIGDEAIKESNGHFSNRGIDRSKGNSDGRSDHTFGSKLVSCSRRTLFKTPRSFNFRRLLPILMEVTKDRSCGLKIGKFHSSLPSKVQNSNDRNHALSLNDAINASGEIESPGVHSDDRRLEDNGVSSNLIQTGGDTIMFDVEQSCLDAELSNGVDEMKKECAQMTPPDIDIFCNPQENSNLENGGDSYLQTEYRHSAKSVIGSIRRNDNCVDKSFSAKIYRGKNSTLKSQLALNPCSRPKVFRNPTSFSYRRLLPFLTNIATDDSCASKGVQCPEEKNIEQRPQITAGTMACQEITKHTCTTSSFPKEDHTCDTRLNLPTAVLNPLNCSSDDKLNLLSVKSTTDTRMPFDSQKEQIQVQDIPKILEYTLDDAISTNETTLSAMSSQSPVNPQTFHGEGALEVSHCFIAEEKNKVVWTEFSKDVAKPVETVGLDQNFCQFEVLPFGVPIDGLPRGILKRNPRGCRGLCNCLNCASFRLHADRAFEFSRNQMQDAEEVILELIKELSCLRGMMETSADASYHVAHINQVREACMKAVRTEELARNRLSQMNCDLNVHCRSICLQRPRVSFANSIEEKVIPKADLPTK